MKLGMTEGTGCFISFDDVNAQMLVLDKASIHHVPQVVSSIESSGAIFITIQPSIQPSFCKNEINIEIV